MDPRFPATREELYNVQMDVKQIHIVQNSHAERLSRLEKRQADDAAIKSAWNSPFPSALSGTPQHGPIQMPPNEMFDDFEEQGQSLLGSLHLDAEDEPARRGAASRANSVRFDESALQGSSWAQNGRQSGDFGPIRPGSGLGSHGMMERSMSHKSDGRHSSAGHSVHSIHSHHSVASGRGSSLGLDTTFTPGGHEDDSPMGIPEPPPSLFILGSVPSIIRCWLTPNFSHDTLLYADICTGSQKSMIEFSLVKDLDLVDDIHRDLDGVYRIRLHVYLTEATVSHPNSRGHSPAPQMPSLGCFFEVSGMDQPDTPDSKKAIRIFIGSETLREHSADVLFSQNRMTLYSSDREKLSVPFVRPEDHGAFKNIRTMSISTEKPKLNATARPFVLGEAKTPLAGKITSDPIQAKATQDEPEIHEANTPTSEQASQQPATTDASTVSESGAESEHQSKENNVHEHFGIKDRDTQSQGPDGSSDGSRRASGAGSIWNSWRQGTATNGSDSKESTPLSGYQPAGRSRMKVLKPMKSTSSSARTGPAYEPAPLARSSGEQRRKSQTAEGSFSSATRWEQKRSSISGAEIKAVPTNREVRSVSSTPRTSTNPVGGASAFSWMTPTSKPKTLLESWVASELVTQPKKFLNKMGKPNVDYSLYLVTDSTPAILGEDRDICEVVEAALRGGVTCVQYRDKNSDTGALVRTARRLHGVTRRYGVPLLVNDRVDVALAVGCEGVHIGQDDLDVESARKLLGHDKIIGVTVSNAEETAAACDGDADYLGIGTVFATPTKENTKSIIGVDGLQQILLQLARAKSEVKTVCIGGINASNVSRVVWQSAAEGKSLDGVAVVSAIMAATDPEAAARELSKLVKAPPAFAKGVVTAEQQGRSPQELVRLVPEVIRAASKGKPLSHNMTNLVVQNFAANVALCVGASPIMANYGEEAKDLAQLGGALVINMGTVTPEGLDNYSKALKAYNAVGGPVVFDPVGAGATAVRRAATKTILGGGYIDVLKGNRSEILSCLPGGSNVQQRGVDSAEGDANIKELASAMRELATLRKNVVVVTGKIDYVTAGKQIFTIENGHEYLGLVTGTGCCLGTTISAMVAAYPHDKLAAVIAGLLHYNIAAEWAAERDDVKGPGSFVPTFLDELYSIRDATSWGNAKWLKRAKVDVLEI